MLVRNIRITAYARSYCCANSLWPSANDITSSPLSDSVKPYDKHFIVHTGHIGWIKTFPEGESNAIKSVFNNFKAIQKTLPFIPKISGCHLPSQEEQTKITILPDGSEFYLRNNAIEEDFKLMIESTLGGKNENNANYKHHILICAHEAVDKRCGFCGPRLYEQFEERIKHFNLENQVSLMKVTHVGGHKFAGNVIVYPNGDWFGYVTPPLVDEIITGTILNKFHPDSNSDSMLNKSWRGRMHPIPETIKE